MNYAKSQSFDFSKIFDYINWKSIITQKNYDVPYLTLNEKSDLR